jgi:hypothetical protein
MNDDTVTRLTPSRLSSEGKALLCAIEGNACGGFADKPGMSTISFDMSEVREEAEKLLGDWIKTDT